MDEEDVKFERFFEQLIAKLRPAYTPPNAKGGHDYTHVERMVKLGERINFLEFNKQEYKVAVWLHNIDRSLKYWEEIECDGIKAVVRRFLIESPFAWDARDRIVKAVFEHSKKDDEPGDSTLLTALRIADKVDRFGALGVIAIVALHGNILLPYNPEEPFGYASTAERKLSSIYNDCFRVLEWYAMLPSDKARALIAPEKLEYFISTLRLLGREIADATGAKNLVEEDIKKALGSYYEPWKPVEPESSPELMDLFPGLRGSDPSVSGA